METEMEELKMYHSTVGKGPAWEAVSAATFTIYYQVISFQ